jgi:RNA polymerase sigma factor (sigma-70 family)
MRKKCQICNEEIFDRRKLKWGQGGKGEIHLDCYTPDKQKDYDVTQYKTDSKGESSPYWAWAERTGKRNSEGEYEELPEANPDVLSDDSSYWNTDDEENQENRKKLLQKFATSFNKLTKRQREVAFALEKYKTEEKVAKALKVSQQAVSKTLLAIRKKLKSVVVFTQNQYIE